MYTFELLDACFAIVMLIILLVMAYVIGYTSKMERLNKALARETKYVDTLLDTLNKSELSTASLSDISERSQHLLMLSLQSQEKSLKKQHREAMKKYKARCDAKLASQIDFIEKTARVKTVQIKGFDEAFDTSALLSK